MNSYRAYCEIAGANLYISLFNIGFAFYLFLLSYTKILAIASFSVRIFKNFLKNPSKTLEK